MMKTFRLNTLTLLAVITLSGLAHADLMLYPTRVVLETNQRAAQVDLVNRGTKPETYRISLVNRRMTETGVVVEAIDAQPGEQFADAMLRYSPRQVTLQPGTSQTVRLVVRKPPELPTGEYRSHLLFDRVPDAAGQSNLDTTASQTTGQVTVVLEALIGASIPVIVRHGPTEVTANLSDLALAPGTTADKAPELTFKINRGGNRSVYGDFTVRFTPRGGQSMDVAKAAGMAVYVPNAVRSAHLPLQLPPGTVLAGGTLQLSYRERVEAGGKLIAEASLAVP